MVLQWRRGFWGSSFAVSNSNGTLFLNLQSFGFSEHFAEHLQQNTGCSCCVDEYFPFPSKHIFKQLIEKHQLVMEEASSFLSSPLVRFQALAHGVTGELTACSKSPSVQQRLTLGPVLFTKICLSSTKLSPAVMQGWAVSSPCCSSNRDILLSPSG